MIMPLYKSEGRALSWMKLRLDVIIPNWHIPLIHPNRWWQQRCHFQTLGLLKLVRAMEEQLCDCTWYSTHLLILRVLGVLIPYQHTHHLPFHPNRWWWCTACSVLALELLMLGGGTVLSGVGGWLYLHIFCTVIHLPCCVAVHCVQQYNYCCT